MTLSNKKIDVNIPSLFRPFECKDLVRLGRKTDGGYLINREDVKKTDILISFGIGDDWSFEKDFSQLNDCQIVSFDKNSKVPKNDNFYVNQRKMIYKNIGIEDTDDTVSFYNINSIESNNIFLKCDIEGKEYELLFGILQMSHKFSGICIEFHAVNHPKAYNHLTNFISKIDHKLVHVHANNTTHVGEMGIPDVLEMTFTSSKNCYYNPNLTLPHMLDCVNNPQLIDFKVNFHE